MAIVVISSDKDWLRSGLADVDIAAITFGADGEQRASGEFLVAFHADDFDCG